MRAALSDGEGEGGGAHAGGSGERDLNSVAELDLVGAGLGFLVGVGEVLSVVVAEVFRRRFRDGFRSGHEGHVTGCAGAAPALDVGEAEAANLLGAVLVAAGCGDHALQVDGRGLRGELHHAKGHGGAGEDVAAVGGADERIDEGSGVWLAGEGGREGEQGGDEEK